MENRERHEPRERGGDGHEWDERERERRRSGRFGRREFSQEENEGRWWQHQDYGPRSSGYHGSQEYWGPSYGRGYSEELGPSGGGRMSQQGQQGWGQQGGHSYGPQGGGMYGQFGQQGGGMYGQGQFGGQGGYGTPYGQQGGMYGQGTQGGFGRMSQQGAGGQGRFGQEGPYRGRGPQNYKRSDERIREDASECLTEHGLVDASGIEITVMNGEVTLKGTVPNRHMKRMCEDVIEDLSGVKEVNNQLLYTSRKRLVRNTS